MRESLPVPAPIMMAMFGFVESRLAESGCDNTLRYTQEFIRSHNLLEDALVAWLEDHGGYCDCEVLMNAEEVVEEAVPGYSDLPPAF